MENNIDYMYKQSYSADLLPSSYYNFIIRHSSFAIFVIVLMAWYDKLIMPQIFRKMCTFSCTFVDKYDFYDKTRLE